MSILPYLKRCYGDILLPDSGGKLPKRIPSNAISSANHHVAEILKHTKRPRGNTTVICLNFEQIGKVASQIGIKAAITDFYSHVIT